MGEPLKFDYYYGMEAEQFTFYRVPRLLIKDKRFKGLSSDAKLLYGLMLDCMALSMKNGWIDKENRAYIIYSVENVMEDLGCSKPTCIKIIRELDSDKGIGLIEKKRRGLGKPDIIYVKNFASAEDKVQGESDASAEVKVFNFKKESVFTSEGKEAELQEVKEAEGKFLRSTYFVLLAKSKRATERLLESSTKYLEETLKLTVNKEKSRTVSVFAIRNFKFLGFALGRSGSGIYVRVHPKSWKKFKSKLKELSSRRSVQSIKPSLGKIKVYARGWLNYYGIASMKNNIEDINGWLYHRIRMCIWKQWKKPKTKIRNLLKMGVPMELAWQAGNSRRGDWFTTHTVAVNMAMTKERLINSGFYDLAVAYQSVHVNY